MKAEGMEDESGLQAWVTSHFIRYLEKKCRWVVGWDEILAGDVPTDAIGMTWRMSSNSGAKTHYVSAADAAARGHDMVMTPNALCYLSYPQFEKGDPYPYYGVITEKSSVLTLERAYSYDPVAGVPESCRSRIIGGQASCWSESTFNVFDLEWKTWPRACAIAETLWLGDAKPEFGDFRLRMESHRRRLIEAGVNCAPLATPKYDIKIR